jgi:hypothetical protein
MNVVKLAREILNNNEFQLAEFLSDLLGNPKCKFVYLLMEDILPVYYEKSGAVTRTLSPDPIYRPLYYIHSYSISPHFEDCTRAFIAMTGAHIEGCLYWLTKEPQEFGSPSKPFGGLVKLLFQEGVLPEKLVNNLFRFNEVANIPAKHFIASHYSRSLIDERTFSVFDAALDFVMMRNLSIQLFSLLLSKRVALPHLWKEFDNEWLSEKWRSH